MSSPARPTPPPTLSRSTSTVEPSNRPSSSGPAIRTGPRASKPEPARRMLERPGSRRAGTCFLAGEAYRQYRALRARLEVRRVRYVFAVPKDQAVPLSDKRTRQARELYALVPEEAFERRSGADGAKGGPRDYGQRPPLTHRPGTGAPPADPPLHCAQEEGEEGWPTRARGQSFHVAEGQVGLIPRRPPTPGSDHERVPSPLRPDRPRPRSRGWHLAGHALGSLAHPPPGPVPNQPLPRPSRTHSP